MSQRSSFTREEKQNLNYDDNAFMHFLLAVVGIFALYHLYVLLRQALNPLRESPWLKDALKAPWYRKKYQARVSSRFTAGWLFRLLVAIFFVLLTIGIYHKITTSETKLQGFDPYEILGVEYNAPMEKIKKAYKKLALKHHPDKNKGDPQSTAKFIQISKAYECFESEENKEKCLQYGNADGNQAMNVGIALPAFLVQKKHQVPVMIVTFFFLLVVIPLAVWLATRNLMETNSIGLNKANEEIVVGSLSENVTFKTISQMLSICVEFHEERIKQKQPYERLSKALIATEEFSAKDYNNRPNFACKVLALLEAAVIGVRVPEELREEQRRIVETAIGVLKAAIKFSVLHSCRMILPPGIRFLGRNCIQCMIEYRACLIQMLPQNSNPLYQLSLTPEDKETFRKKKKVIDFRSLLFSEKEKEKLNSLFPDKRALHDEELSRFPRYELQAKATLSQHQGGEEDLVLTDRDMPKFKITVRRSPGLLAAFSQEGNFLVEEVAFVYLHLPNLSILYFKEVEFEVGQLEVTLVYNNMRSFQKGSHELQVSLRSGSYLGVGVDQTLKFEVKSLEEVSRSMFVHPDDKSMPKQKGMFSVIGLDKDSDEELSSGDED